MLKPVSARSYDAVLLVSFGGPERREEVIPFLENVVRGKAVPRERLLAVAEHYYAFGGKSPINDQNRALVSALRAELATLGPDLPVYLGNRNWHPLLADTIREMARDGVKRAIAFVTSAFSSYSGCRQYRENIANAREQAGSGAPEVDKIRPFFNHPAFIESMADRVSDSLADLAGSRGRSMRVIYTAHSIPKVMAETSAYVAQLNESARLVSEAVGVASWELAFQSRSGPPTQPWLEPDICDRLRELRASGIDRVSVVPIGFLSDHIEVLHDLDAEAAGVAREQGMAFARARTVGVHPRFVAGVRDLISERTEGREARPVVGEMPASPDTCPIDCCPRPAMHRSAGRARNSAGASRAGSAAL